MARCTQCGAPTDAEARFCRQCGFALPVAPCSEQTPGPPPTKAEAVRAVIRAGSKALVRNLALSAAVLGPGFAMLATGSTFAGMVWLFVGSFGLMAWTYRKPWRLGWISCMMPPLAAGLCYLLQLALFGKNAPALIWVALAIAAGAVLGWVRGRAHQVYVEKSVVFAQRTHFYLLLWALAYLITQAASLGAASWLAVQGGLISGAFTTAMLVAVSMVLFARMRAVKVTGAAAILVALSGLLFDTAVAQTRLPSDRATAVELMRDAASRVGAVDIQPGDFNLRNSIRIPLQTPQISERSRDMAQAFYAVRYQPYTINTTVTLTRHASATAAQLTSADLQGMSPFQQTANYRGMPVYGGMSYQTQDNKTFAISMVILTTRENFKIAVRMDYTVQPAAGDSSGGIAGAAASAGAAIAAMIAPPLFVGASIAAQYQRELRLDGSVSSREQAAAPPPMLPQAAPQAPQSEMSTGPDEAAIAASTALIATILIGAGVAASVAQAIAAAMAAAVQAGVQVTAEDVSAAVMESLGRRNPTADETAQPIVQQTGPPPIVNPKSGETFETNEDGKYWAPDEKGNWTWLGSDEARAAVDALQAEADARAREGEQFQRESEIVRDELKERSQREDQAAQSRAAASAAAAEAAAKTEPSPPAQPAEKPPDESFLAGIWRRVSGGMRSAAAEAGDTIVDIVRDPRILTDAVGSAAREVGELGAKAVRGGVDLVTGKTIAEAGRDLGEYVRNNPREIAEGVAGTLQDVGNLINGKTLAEAGAKAGDEIAQFARDVYRHPTMLGEVAGETLRGMGRDVKAAADAVRDPDKVVDAVKAASGMEHFEKALDPKRPLADRLGQVGLGVVSLEGTLSGAKAVASGVKAGASRIISKISGEAATNLADDAARLAATARAEAGATRAEAGTAARTEAAAVRGTEQSAAAARTTEATGSSARAETAAARGTSQAAEAADAGKAAGELTPVKPKGVAVNKDGSYPAYLEARSRTRTSTIGPGSRSDLVPAEGVVPDTRGFTRTSEKHIQMIADRHGVQIHARPTTPGARVLLERGEALPKPELIKNKTINQLDTLLGAPESDLSKVGHFKPTKPLPIGTTLPNGKVMDQALHDSAMKRFAERAQEFDDQSAYLAKLKGKVRVEGGLVTDSKTGLPFTGDVDGFSIRGLRGEPLPKAVVKQVEAELVKGPGNVMHGMHDQWEYTRLSRSRVDGGQSKFATAQGIDHKIRESHAPVVKLDNGKTRSGEALVTYSGREADGPYMRPNPTASWWMGGTHNPLVFERTVAPIADRHMARITMVDNELKITGLAGEKLPDSVVNQIKEDVRRAGS